MLIAVVDYGMGNLRSVSKALESLGKRVVVTADAEAIESAEVLILPGVGSFRKAMDNLRERGLIEAIKAYSQTGGPLLGICLGMQLMATIGEEGGTTPGLGLIPGTVRRFPPGLKVPHVGWNRTFFRSPKARDPEWFYYVHSFYLDGCQEEDVIATANYGLDFPAAIRHRNVFGVQFHPEKSSSSGLALLDRFLSGKGL